MTWLGRLFGAPVPAPVVSRVEPRAPRLVRSYAAARPDRLAGGFQFSGFPTSNPELVRQNLRGLINHARFAARNTDYAKAFLKLVARNVIGPSGIQIAPKIKENSGAFDTEANRQIRDAWRAWGEPGIPSAEGMLSWHDIELMTIHCHARDGNMLLRERTGPRFGPFGYQLQPMSIDQLDLDYNIDLEGGRHIAGGIEMDGDGRRLAYHMFTRHPGANWGRGALERVRIPAGEIIHIFPVEDPGQFLGVPPLHTALRRLNMLGEYEESALANAHFGARSLAFLQRAEQDDSPTRDDGGEGDEENRFQIDLDSASLMELPPGYELKDFDPAYPDGEFGTFVSHMLRGAAAGAGVSYHGLANDLTGANFSSLHYGANEERDEWRLVQKWLMQRLHSRVFQAWLPMALLTGQLRLPVARLEKFRAVEWRPRGWPAVNPRDEANSSATRLANGLTSPQRELARRGEDFEEVIEELAAAIDKAKGLGVPLDFVGVGTAAAGAPTAASET